MKVPDPPAALEELGPDAIEYLNDDEELIRSIEDVRRDNERRARAMLAIDAEVTRCFGEEARR